MNLDFLERVGDYEWLIPTRFREDMRVPVRLIASEAILGDVSRDKSIEQAVNAATLPGLVGEVVVMPDMHQGYGFPIGGVAATSVEDGVISPGAIGYDINCGVRLLSTDMLWEDVKPWADELADALNRNCPSGVGVGGRLNLRKKELEEICVDGSAWARRHGFATEADLELTEGLGQLDGADPAQVSERAMKRGMKQVGTLGAGNHFLEVDVVQKIYDEEAAFRMGLEEGKLVLQIHCGSRGFGHQICSDHVSDFQTAVQKYDIDLPDRGLVCAPISSTEGKGYLAAMRCAANYAFANRQVLAHYARLAFEETLAGRVRNWDLNQVYDLAHNIGKVETHTVDGRETEVCVHRKGATRAFGPGHPELPAIYQTTGQPVLVPGSMGTASWVLSGTVQGMDLTFGSCCHGAGRMMSRKAARKTFRANQLMGGLEKQGVRIRAGSFSGITEEAPGAYKDVDAVVESVVGARIANKVARLTPVLVVKG
jgi:tRNA-splicing ligase RtcB